MHRKPSSRCATRPTDRPTATRPTLAKTARANAQTLRAIRYLQENDALETLPEVLQQAAAVRLQYPDLSLTALCGCFDPAVSKSGLSHRMKKLEALADALRQRMEKDRRQSLERNQRKQPLGQRLCPPAHPYGIQSAGRCLPHRPTDGPRQGMRPDRHCLHRPRRHVRLCAVL